MNILRTLLLGIFGGGIFQCLHVPLPWTLGPIAAIAGASFFFKQRFFWPRPVREIALILLGYAMGRPFTLDAGRAIINQLPFMLMATLVTVSAGVFTGWLMYKKTGIDLTSCLLGCVPGGLSQMVILADEMEGTDATAITLMQTMRMLSVVFVVPFLTMHVLPATGNGANLSSAVLHPDEKTVLIFSIVAISGAVLGRKLHLPTATLLGPILSTGIYIILSGGQMAPLVPLHLLNVAQLCVGSYIGTTINLAKIRQYHGMLPCLSGGIVLVLLASFFTGTVVAACTGASFATGFLSTAPGGLTEMGITALLVGADISTMTAYQLVRLLFIMLVFPYLARGIVYFYQNHQDAHKKKLV